MEKQLTCAAIICEYNPFHHGHAYQIETVHRDFDVVMGVMSGAFVQRGMLAVADKYSRAAAAVNAGMDLVLELPFPYCCAAAPDFAAAGVHIAAAMQADALAFGCEDRSQALCDIASLLSDGTLKKEAEKLIKEEKSLSYPRALRKSCEKLLGTTAAECIEKPNNILAVEYLCAIKNGGYKLKPCFVERNFAFLSSTAIRESGNFEALLPLPHFFDVRRDIKYMERAVLYTLRQGVDGAFYGVDSTLKAKLTKTARAACSLDELISLTVDKVYTAGRVRRAILALYLGISTDAVKAKPVYTNLLAANEKGLAYLKQIKKAAEICVLTKPAAYKKHPETVKAFEVATAAEELAALCTEQIPTFGTTLKRQPRLYK